MEGSRLRSVYIIQWGHEVIIKISSAEPEQRNRPRFE